MSFLDLPQFEEMLKRVADRWLPEGDLNGFESEQLTNGRRLLKAKETFERVVDDLEEGFNILIEQGPKSASEKLRSLTEGEGIDDLFEEIMRDSLIFTAALDLTDEEMDELYKIALTNDLSSKLFCALLFLDYTDIRFWIGLGEAYEKLGDLEMAQAAFEFSLIVALDDPLPYLHFAKFLIRQNDPLAKIAIDEGIERTKLVDDQETLSRLTDLLELAGAV